MNNVKLGNDVPDTDYLIATGSPVFENTSPLARLSPLTNGILPDAASEGSRWLVLNSGVGIEGITVAPGTYLFDIDVDLTGFVPSSAELRGLRYSADNKLTGVHINGTTVFSQNASFAEEFQDWHDIGDVGLGEFQDGVNTIRFEVLNDLSASSPMTLRVEGNVEAPAIVPEPSAFLLAAAALLALLAFAHRRQFPSGQ